MAKVFAMHMSLPTGGILTLFLRFSESKFATEMVDFRLVIVILPKGSHAKPKSVSRFDLMTPPLPTRVRSCTKVRRANPAGHL